jgi:hypothetical protein
MSEGPRLAIEYDQLPAGGGMTRRQGRWIIVLMLVNTVLLAIGLVGPQLGPAVRKEYFDWRARRDAAKSAEQRAATRAQQHQQLLAIQAQWMAHTFPPDTVVYEEDPKIAAANLLSGKGYRAIRPPMVPMLMPWQSPVIAPTPRLVNQLAGSGYAPDDGILFLHERRMPAGEAKLVCVTFAASQSAVELAGSLDQRVVSDLTLNARAFDPIRPDSDAVRADELKLWKLQPVRLVVPPQFATVIHFTGTSRPGPHEIRTGTYLKLLAGTADPKDPSHFTIPYQLGEMSGTIDGWLRNDAIELRGREGEMGPQSSWVLPAPKP